ncbi:MAG: NAD(P)H-quinone oxidoreductase [Pseudomonadota bacterium]
MDRTTISNPALPSLMVCAAITSPGDPSVLLVEERPLPSPGPGEVLIRVAAAGVNRPDILQRKGFYPPPPGASDLPGLEVSGTIIAMGHARDGTPDRANRLGTGDEVCALLPGGGYATYAVADERLCLPRPHNLSLTEAAGLPETLFTVWANLFDDAGLKAGETMLVHGATSGIGTMAIAMAKAFGATVVATAGTTEKCAAAKTLGADHAMAYTDDHWETVIQEEPINGVDVILDMTGGDFFERNIACLRPGGRHVSIAFLRGNKGDVDIFALMRKCLTVTGSTLRARTPDEKARLARDIYTHVWPKIEAGDLKPVIHKAFPLTEAANAHRLMEEGSHVGKILLVP